MKQISATSKGLITGLAMIIISILVYIVTHSFDNWPMYLVYLTYMAGLLWTLFIFKYRTENTASFKAYFSEGFKCFIVVTLLMVLFNLVFILMHPELKEQMAVLMRADYAQMKDLTPVDIENRIASQKKFFLPGYLMGAVLVYLVIGALVTVITAGFLSASKNNN